MEWWDELVNALSGDGGGAVDSAMMAAGSTPVSYGASAGTPFYLDPRFLQGAGSAIGGLSQAYAGQRAASTQADAADRAAALQERIYNSMALRNQGAETGGNLARDRYLELVGLTQAQDIDLKRVWMHLNAEKLLVATCFLVKP